MTKPTEMQKASLRWKRQGHRVVLVPTMGALHRGHEALIRRARQLGDRVVVSSYVNPTQFNQRTDYSNYPKRPGTDLKIAKTAGADVLFRPQNLYHSDSSTWVEETARSQGRCGPHRPNHFRGVATIVTKLINVVQPDVAVFGEKDHQQCEVVERVVRDLFLPVRIVRHRAVRESDGLPLSSRNLRLSRAGRLAAGRWALALRQAAAAGSHQAQSRYRILLRGIGAVRSEYAEIVDGCLHAAVWIGGIRLIDHRPCRGRR